MTDDVKQCFVISPIGEEGSDIRRAADMVLNVCIVPALCEVGFNCVRADEISSPGMINDQIIKAIVESPLVVADLSTLNPNVFYELGLRHAAKKPCIHLVDQGTRLPFDASGYRAIVYRVDDFHSLKVAGEELAKQAQSTQVEGYKVNSPFTQAQAYIENASSPDPMDQQIATMSERIGNLESRIRTLTQPLNTWPITMPSDYNHTDLSSLGSLFDKMGGHQDILALSKSPPVTASNLYDLVPSVSGSMVSDDTEKDE
ncbi:MAG: hypothetical protein JXQ99_16130 [Hyphomicrobiaceae bacterium]